MTNFVENSRVRQCKLFVIRNQYIIRRSFEAFRVRIILFDDKTNFHLYYVDMGDFISLVKTGEKKCSQQSYHLAIEIHVLESTDTPEFTAIIVLESDGIKANVSAGPPFLLVRSTKTMITTSL